MAFHIFKVYVKSKNYYVKSATAHILNVTCKQKTSKIMNKFILILLLPILSPTLNFAQDCNCESNFEWVKNTFEENDAGFEHTLNTKGEQAYADHNKRILERVKSAQELTDCASILYEWMTFFRSGHIAIRLHQQPNDLVTPENLNQFVDWETYPIKQQEFIDYLNNSSTSSYEGIWQSEPYKIGIKRDGDTYIGFIIESGAETWTEGQVKLKINIADDETSSVFYMWDHSAVESKNVLLIGNNHLEIGDVSLIRLYPTIEEEPKYEQYFQSLHADLPYIDVLNETTLYFRIPSFDALEKRAIDSTITANKNKILSTENLIIDIRNGTGGSDASYENILPLLYTNPIRAVGVEFLSTKLNNQRMLDLINNAEYGLDQEEKEWARKAFDKLEENLGEFVNVEDYIVEVTKLDTIHPNPKNVGIIINKGNGSTDEQFLLAAKQSKKVKLFGTTTYGVLDISNMYFISSPCNEFELGYSLSRSMRIPNFTIDEKGIQPDYYLDKSIPIYEWAEYVNGVLNEK